MNTPKWSIGFLALLCASTALIPARAQDKPTASEVIIKMDPYVVEGERVLPPPESWRYVSVPAGELTKGNKVVIAQGYEILSNLSEKNTKRFAEDLQLRQFAGTLLWPMIVQAMPRQSLVVIIDRTKQAWTEANQPTALAWQGEPIATAIQQAGGFDSRSFATGYQELRPDQGFGSEPAQLANPMNTRITPANQDPTNTDPNGPDVLEKSAFGKRGLRPLTAGFTRVRALNGVVAAQINADVPKANVEDLPVEEQLSADLSRRAAEYALMSFPQRPPQWFYTGLGWLVASTQVTPTRITFADTNGMMDNRAMPSLAALLNKTTASTEEDDLLAATFTHYGLYGDNGKHAEQFMTLVQRQSQGAVTAEQFQEIFGVSIKQMEVALATYSRSFANYKSTELQGRLPELPPFTVREATQSEVARMQADSLITQGKPDLALNILRIAYWRGEREPAMLAVLAGLEEKQGSLERARKITQALMALPAPPARVFTVEARLRFRDATANKQPQEKLTVAETRTIMGPLGRAVQAGQDSEDIWAFFSDVVLRSAGHPHESITGILDRATKRFPNNVTIREAAAFAQHKP